MMSLSIVVGCDEKVIPQWQVVMKKSSQNGRYIKIMGFQGASLTSCIVSDKMRILRTTLSKFFYGEPHGKNKENGKRRWFRGERGGDNPCQENGKRIDKTVPLNY